MKMIFVQIGTYCTFQHWILMVFRLFQAFVLVDGGKSPEKFFGDLRTASCVVKTAFLFASLVLCDILTVSTFFLSHEARPNNHRFIVFGLSGVTNIM